MDAPAPHINALARQRVRETYAPLFEGAPECLFLAVVDHGMGSSARTALDNSAQALGWGNDAVTYLAVDGGGACLSAAQLFEIIEGADPVCLAVSGAAALPLFAEAYRTQFSGPEAARVAGRSCCVFPSLDALMDTPQHKQTAWTLLKTLSSPAS